jgi:hypothetical protein
MNVTLRNRAGNNMLGFGTIALAILAGTARQATAQLPLTTAFTYQGELTSAGSPAAGTYDIRYRLFDAPSGGNQIGSTLCSDNLAVTAGRFAATLDFGAPAFSGQQRYLEIEVRQDAGTDCADDSGYTILTSRQQLTAAPYATFASSAGFAQSANSASNATQLGGQAPEFYTSAANLSSGTIDPARLPATTVRSSIPNAFGPSPNTFGGPVGLGTTSPASLFDVVGFYRTGAANALDQQQAVQNSFGTGTDLWQSFTAGQSGQLTRIEFNGASGVGGQSRTATIQIYAGEGTAGALMATSTITLLDASNGAWVTSSIPGQLLVVAGRQYTIRISITGSNIFLSASDANSYLGGRTNGPDFRDYMFRTFVTPATQTSMFNIGMNGVGIGTNAPTSMLSVAGNADVSGNLAVGGNLTAGVITANLSGNAITATNATLLSGQPASFYTSASNLSSGTLPDARLAANIPRLNTNNAFTSSQNSFVGRVGVNTPAGALELDVNGRINVASGVIQKDLSAGVVTATTDLGLYSQVAGGWVRFVTNNAQFAWFTDSGAGTTPRMVLSPTGNLNVSGSLAKAGGSFKIDHPLDPENKYLYHSFVESPDMMNIYNGNVTTDASGYAVITLPDYFEALNRDFRYQLTVLDDSENDFILAKVYRKIGVDAPRQFTIRTSMPGIEVSWQVTGIRQDAWAQKNRIPNSIDKPAAEKGTLLHPEAFGKPASPAAADLQPATR